MKNAAARAASLDKAQATPNQTQATPNQTTLSTSGLRVGYSNHEILRGVTMQPLRAGTVTGLIGPNAAGKSTLVKTIAGIKKASAGEVAISVDGETVGRKDLKNVVGYVPQDQLTSASLTAFEEILVATRQSRAVFVKSDALELTGSVMEKLGITHLADRFVSELSGGQRQLVAVAQMLVRQPNVLLLDEPTSALDLRHQVELLHILKREVVQSKSLAVVAIHDLNLAARYCDTLVVLCRGEVIAQGSPAEVLCPDLLEEVYGLRARVLDDDGVPVVCPAAETRVDVPIS